MESDTISTRITIRRQSELKESTYYRVMRLLQEQLDMSQRDTNIGALNYCLRALIHKGLVKLESIQNNRHKFKYGYTPTPASIAHRMAMTSQLIRAKLKGYEQLAAEVGKDLADSSKTQKA